MSSTFKHVRETDETGAERAGTVEVGPGSIDRHGIRWSARLPISAVLGVSCRRSMFGGDTVTVSTAAGSISWKLRDGQALVDAIDAARAGA